MSTRGEDPTIADLSSREPVHLPDSLLQLGLLRPHQQVELPRFLIISPPKTGSSWLAANLAAHPAFSMPPEKEARFFSSGWKWCDLQWYLSRFPKEPGRVVRGESSPTYSLLPIRTIRLLRQLIPDLKLIFQMRDPVQRAWSHARHCVQYHEANFVDCTLPIDSVPDGAWRDNLMHDWNCASGDYLGQLRRWLSVFPRKQIYLSFYEEIKSDPRGLMHRVFNFLGVDRFDLDSLRCDERINVGRECELSPELADCLRQIHQKSTDELVTELKQSFNMTVPAAWDATLKPRVQERPELGAVMQRIRTLEFDDDFLTQTMTWEEQSDTPRLLHDSFIGYRLYLYRRRVFALQPEVQPESLRQLDAGALAEIQEQGRCLWGATTAEVHDRIGEFLQREIRRARQAESELTFRLPQMQRLVLEAESLRSQAAECEVLREELEAMCSLLGEAIVQRDLAQSRLPAPVDIEQQARERAALESELKGLKASRWYRIAGRYRRTRQWMRSRVSAMFGL